MSQNKRNEHTGHYFDPRVLENYCRNDVLLTFELAGRQAGRLIAKGELEMKQNELQAMFDRAVIIQKILFETHECSTGICADCNYYSICEATNLLLKFIQHELNKHNAKGELKDDNN